MSMFTTNPFANPQTAQQAAQHEDYETPSPAPDHRLRPSPDGRKALSPLRPSAAFIGISWVALLVGATSFLIGLYNAEMLLSAKGFYLTLLMYGLFSAVAVQKAVRDRLEGVPVSALFVGLAWASVAAVLVLLSVGLWNAELLRSEKGFYAMSFLLSMFAAVAVQKNVRDTAAADALAAGEDDA